MSNPGDTPTVSLVMTTTEGIERVFPLNKPKVVIGRESRCDVRVPVPAVERRHCEVLIEDGRIQVNDLETETGTFRNGERVETATLDIDDQLTIGPVTFLVRTEDGQPRRMEIKPIPRSDR